MSEATTGPQDEFDSVVIESLQLDEEEARELRNAIMNLNYEEFYKPLWRRHEEFVRKTKLNYIILSMLLLTSIALQIVSWLWWNAKK